MRLLIILYSILLLSTSTSAQNRKDIKSFASDEASKTLVIKIKRTASLDELQHRLASFISNKNIKPKQTHPLPIKKSDGTIIRSSYGLDRIYKLEVPANIDVNALISKLSRFDIIEYVELTQREELLYLPNDTEASLLTGRQNHLDLIRAYDAWEVEKGDSSIIIGILATEVNLNHEDLRKNIFLNEADPINGIDDDNDGFIDNYYGWDFADEDNNPSDVHNHGTQVSGIAAARTNNGIGIAGMGFNSKFMPIKIYTNVGTSFYNGYEAILYAAAKGCKVINLSWGSVGSFSRYVEDIINTVVLDMDVVVVAAAGNSNKNEEYYPASYEYVLSVGNTQKDATPDEKSSGSTFSPYISLSAPGANVFTTSGIGYAGSSGTSMASPGVAGAAALVRAKFPELNALQVMERLRMSADDIYHIGKNHQYKELLGRGRLNMYNALVDSTSSAVRFRNMTYRNNIGNIASYGDTINISGEFVNYLKEVKNLKISLSIESPYIEIIDSVNEFSLLPTLTPEVGRYKVYVKPNLPPGLTLRFRLGFEGDNYSDYQYFDIKTLPDYYTVNNGTLAMTIGSNGNLGYNSDQFSDGTGITYNSEYILDFMSLLIAKDKENISDNMFNSYHTLKREKDFQIEKSMKVIEDSDDFVVASSIFNDTGIANSLGLHIEQSLSGFKSVTKQNFLFLDYKVQNRSGQRHDSLKVGLYTDWDIVDSMKNYSGFDPDYNLSYGFYPQKNIFAGIALVHGETSYNSISLYNENWNFIFGSEISEAEKYSLFENSAIPEIGPANVASTLSTTLYEIEDESTINLHFVITAGASLEELRNNIKEAQILRSFVGIAPYHACIGETININPGLSQNLYFYSDSLFTNLIGEGHSLSLTTPIDFENVYIKTEGEILYQKYKTKLIIAENFQATFDLPQDSIILDHTNAEHEMYLESTSSCVVKTEWYVNNLKVSDISNPTLAFNEGGIYDIQLKVWNHNNTIDSISKKLVVEYITSIAEEAPYLFDIFPNPASKTLNISLAPTNDQATITIYDQPGRIALYQPLLLNQSFLTLDIAHLRPGLYIIRLKTKKQNITKKIIVK